VGLGPGAGEIGGAGFGEGSAGDFRYHPGENWRTRLAKTILVCEDNELNLRLFVDLLAAAGYRTLAAMNGNDAVNLARAHRPDLIQLDIGLPGLSGLEVVKELKDDAALKDIPVIAVTAHAMKGDDERIVAGGCDGYIPKPISVRDYLGTIASFLFPSPTLSR